MSTLTDLDGDGLPDLVVTYECDAEPHAVGGEHWLVHRNTGADFEQDPIRWSLPEARRHNATNTSRCVNGDLTTLVDLDGDGLLDLVVTYECDVEPHTVGGEHWLVYRNTGAGFERQPIRWGLPGVRRHNATNTSSCVNGDLTTLVDLDGDGLLDLVVTYECDVEPHSVGGEHWLVYRNTGAGFERQPIRWGLPGARRHNATNTSRCVNGDLTTLVDLDGDGLLDLVVTYECDAQEHTVGANHWLLYRNTGEGFSRDAGRWALPGARRHNATSTVSCVNGDLTSLMDVDGDGPPELLVTYECDAQAHPVGSDHWLLYRNVGAGFALDPVQWSLPGMRRHNATFTGSCVNGDLTTTTDLNGDGVLDLVVTYECDAEAHSVGGEHWLVYSGVCAD